MYNVLNKYAYNYILKDGLVSMDAFTLLLI